jgi:hypothetical protein
VSQHLEEEQFAKEKRRNCESRKDRQCNGQKDKQQFTLFSDSEKVDQLFPSFLYSLYIYIIELVLVLNIAEILLKVALNPINQQKNLYYFCIAT